ncbi:hypothetical protein PM3016_4783 [Paenibacillus mucilaginosus 3016]|uniref:DUF3967 domain-containing protein n=2 Tax=Paenibacillus mucilaginosus TaxID=61624 RepID=H6NIB8_9BACL|nr:hypothetical protein [Paenibacillus mucilaginosus]AFC31521.1 hypothetical protein PM3016_4783 [Paenibacillus mucilaginosus 3016]
MNIESLAQRVFVSEVSLKRWCVLMEKYKYKFALDEQGERDFTERDVEAIKWISMKLLDGKELRVAVKEVVSQYLTPEAAGGGKQTVQKLGVDEEEIKSLIHHLFDLRMKDYMESSEQRLADLELKVKETGSEQRLADLEQKVKETGSEQRLADLEQKVKETEAQVKKTVNQMKAAVEQVKETGKRVKETEARVTRLEKDQDTLVTEVLVLHEKVDESTRQNEAYRKIREDEIMNMMKEILETRRMVAAARERRWQGLWKTVTQVLSPKKQRLNGRTTS